MAQLKVIASKLNIRTHPVLDFADKSNVVGILHQDTVFESVGEITNELGTWYVNRDGNWASEKWLGEKSLPGVDDLPSTSIGVNVQQYIDDRFDGVSIKETIDYNFLLNIPQEMKQTNGKDSVIGILDVPISTDISFENIVRPGNIITKEAPTEHSNFIAGIIGSKATSNIKGICSMATILDLAFFDTSGNLISDNNYYDRLLSCIESFDKTKVIINVSYSLDDNLKFVIDKLKELKNVIFVCSAGTDTKLLDINNTTLLDSPNAISVGTASFEFINSNKAQIDKRLNIILPILSYVSYNNDGITFSKIPDSSSSWGTAVISCIIALLYSNNQLNQDSTKTEIISKIQNLSNDSFDFLNILKF